MTSERTLPIAGILLALVTGAIMAALGAQLWLVAIVLLIWIGSFWIVAPPPPPARPASQADMLEFSRTGMRELIEYSGVPAVLIDGDRIVVANSAARDAIGAHIVGQDVRVAFRHPAAIDLLSRGKQGNVTVQGLTGPKSSWEIARRAIDSRYSLLELVDRTAEADISRAHSDFVANASHELRTPLASIIGYVETLVEQRGEVAPERAEKFHQTVLREARRLQSLVDDLMSLSRVEAEKHDRPRDIVSLAQLVTQAANEGAGPERVGRVAIDNGAHPLRVRGDRRQLEQLVRNLVDNALKYGAADGQVDVNLRRGERDMAVLTVTDRGEGIAAEHLPHLTRRFYRTDPGRSRAAGGTGLGLAIVKHIVERHRGRLDIASTLGEGTTVTVRIPLAGEKAA